MSNVRNNSFQSVLDSIIRNYLLNELPPENDTAERDFGLSRLGLGITLPDLPQVPPRTGSNDPNNVHNNNNNYDNVQFPGTSFGAASNGRNNDHEYIKALHKCFEKRGVFKELQTFLRHKLVSILQDEWPDLQNPVRSGDGPNTIVHRLVEDFLRCHRLLYTLSVLASESDVGQQQTRAQYGKLSSREAEDLLDEMGISRDTRLSSQILKCYFDKENFSMLESLHYLGVWLDAPMVTNNLLGESNNNEQEGRKKGTVMFFSKAANDATDQSRKNYKSRNGVHDSLEQRMYELERSMEMEKEMKIKEAIEKFKNEEEVKIRQELEAKFKLDLMEKEREHIVNTQKKVEELNAGMQQERQEWFEVKAKQESEIFKLRKQVSDVMSAMITIKSAQAKAPLVVNGRSELSFEPEKQKRKAESPPSPLVVHCQCDCKQKQTSAVSLNNLEECNTLYSRKKPTFSQESIQIQHDRMSFLQYRMEQQEEEIQGLHRQLLLSTSSSSHHPKPTQSLAATHPDPTQYETDSNEDKNKLDELASFLKESKQRVEKLEKVATEVDVKMQTILIANRKRSCTPLSSELSARATSSLWNKKQAPPTHHLIQAPAITFPPLINLPSPRYLVEEQPIFVSSVQRTLPSFNHDLRSSSIGPALVTERKASTSGQVLPSQIAPTEETRPLTPVNQMFPVAYETQQHLLTTSSRNTLNGKVPHNLQATPKSVPTPPIVAEVVELAPEESLFHMAMREKPVASKRTATNLKQKAMMHGALFREKVSSSSEEGENSRNASLSESISKAITKTKVGREEDDAFPMKVPKPKPRKTSPEEDSMNGRRRQSVIISGPSALVPNVKSISSSSSTSSSKRSIEKQHLQQMYPSTSSQGQKKRASPPRVEDADLSSLSISAPKSEKEDNNEDFWQL